MLATEILRPGGDDYDEDEGEGGHGDSGGEDQDVPGEGGEVDVPGLVLHLAELVWTEIIFILISQFYSLCRTMDYKHL